MPTINIPPRLRFALYMLGAVGTVVVVYLMDKSWVGAAEYKAWTNLAGLLFVLAAAKVNASDTGVVVAGTVEQTTTTTTAIDPDIPDDELGTADSHRLVMWLFVAAVVLTAILMAAK